MNCLNRLIFIIFLVCFPFLSNCASNEQLVIKEKDAGYYFNQGNSHVEKAGYEQTFGNYIVITVELTKAKKGRNEYDRAISLYTKALGINSRDPKIYNNLGVVYANIGQYDKAVSNYNKAIEINPRYALAYYNRGNAYWDKAKKNDKDDEVFSDYNKAIELDPMLANAYNNRGSIYSVHRKYEQAISDYTKAIEINPRFAEAYYNRGWLNAGLKGLDLGISDYNKALEINPRFALAYYNRGIVYSNKGDIDQTISDMTKAIEAKPDFGDAYFDRGLKEKDADKSNKDFKKADELHCILSSHLPNLIRMPSVIERE